MLVPLSPVDFLKRALIIYPDKVAVVDDETRFTYRQFAERCYRLADALHRLGVERGDRVAWIAPNTHSTLESFYGVPISGAVLVPINYRLVADDFAYIINHSGAKVLVLDAEYVPQVASIADKLTGLEQIIIADGPEQQVGRFAAQSYEALLAAASPAPQTMPLDDENATLSINYTSGTTARPKGVQMTHRNEYLNALQYMYHLRVAIDDVYLHTLPMFHANGWTGVWAITGAAATHICHRKIDPPVTVELMEREGVSFLCGSATVLIMLAGAMETRKRPLTRTVRICTAGAPPPAAVIQTMERLGCEVTHVYGLTETGPFITICEWKPEWNALPVEERAQLKARQGVPIICAGDVIVAQVGVLPITEVAHDAAEIGEIVAKGNVMLSGYYNNPDATALAFEGGWFHTGDLAVVHPDNYIQIVDRKKDVIISGGENISSIDVEGVLFQHPAVLEASVIGAPDPRWGEVPVAIVVTRPGASVSEAELIAFARERMAHFKAPKSVEFVDALPKTSTGKVKKFELREKYWAGRDKRVN